MEGSMNSLTENTEDKEGGMGKGYESTRVHCNTIFT